MNELEQTSHIDDELLDDQIEAIFHELDLALRWKRPSILFAIYNSSTVRRSAQEALEKLILEAGQKLVHYQIEYEESLDLQKFIAEITQKQNSIFYIDPLNSDEKESKLDNLITVLNSCKGYLIDNLIRVVFWLTENEALSVAHQAPDFWASRHRVFEFLVEGSDGETDTAAYPVFNAGQVLKTPFSNESEFEEEGIRGESAIVLDLSEGEDPSTSGIQLLLMVGVTNWKEGNHESAIESLHAALAIAQKSGNKTHQAMCYKALALVKSDSGKTDDAIDAYKKVLELEPENVTIWNNIGSLYQKTGCHEDALLSYKKALKNDPNDPVSWHGLGNVYANTARLDEAINCYRKAIQFNAGYMTPWVKLADVLQRQNRFQDALYAYLRTVEMDNKNVHAWSEIGGIYFKAGSYEQAVDAYKKAVDLGMDSPTLQNYLADALAHTGNYSEAIPHFQTAIEHTHDESERAALWNRLGDVHRRMNEYENAVAAYEMADKLLISLSDGESDSMLEYQRENIGNPDNGKIDVNPKGIDAASMVIAGDTIEAQIDVNKQTQSINPAADTVNQVAEKYQKIFNANDRQTETASNSVVSQISVENALLWVRLGNTYLKAGALEKAIDAFLKATNLDPANGQACFFLGQVYTQKLQFSKAVINFQKSVELFPDQKAKANSLNCVGDIYRQMKEYDKALAAFEEAVGYDPENETILSRLSQFQEDLDELSTTGHYPVNSSSKGQGDKNPSSDADEQNQLDYVDRDSEETVTLSTSSEKMELGAQGVVDLNSANVWNELGNIFTRFKAFDEAISAYYKAIEKNPEFGWSYCNLALVYCRQGKPDAAIGLYQKSIALLWTNADKVVAWNRLGDAYRQDGKYNDAIDAYQNADRLKGSTGAGSNVMTETGLDQLLPHFIS